MEHRDATKLISAVDNLRHSVDDLNKTVMNGRKLPDTPPPPPLEENRPPFVDWGSSTETPEYGTMLDRLLGKGRALPHWRRPGSHEVIFEAEVPVMIGNDREHPIGKAQCYRDPHTKALSVEIIFDPDVSEDVENILAIMTTTGLSFAGIKNNKEDN